MNVEEQKQVLAGIVSYLSSVSATLESAVSDVHRLRDEADGDCPFAEELCREIEWLCGDVDSAAGTVKALLDVLQEDAEEEEDEP